jgi:hypothetical protein
LRTPLTSTEPNGARVLVGGRAWRTDDCPAGLGALIGVAGGCHLPQRILGRAFAVVLAGTAFFLLTGALALVVVANTSVWRGATPKLIPSRSR